MKFSTLQSAFLTSTLFFTASLPTVAAEGVYKGCYSDSTPLSDEGPYTWQSSGYCQKKCSGKNKSVYALFGGSDCLCGDEIPSSSKKVSDDKCDVSCNGYPKDKCAFPFMAPFWASSSFGRFVLLTIQCRRWQRFLRRVSDRRRRRREDIRIQYVYQRWFHDDRCDRDE